MVGADGDDAILMRFRRRHFLDRDNIAAVPVIGFETLREAAVVGRSRHGDHVGQQHGEGFVADDFARAPDRVAEAQRGLLAREARRARRGQIGHQRLIFLALAAPRQRVLEFIGHIEMIFDDRLVAAGDEDEMLDAGLARLIDDMLEHRAVDDRQHFLGNRLGGGQKTRAEAGDGQDGLADRLVHDLFSPLW